MDERVQNPKFRVDGFQRGMLGLAINDEMGHQLCDVLEAAMAAGVVVPPAVYAMGERVAHRIDPGCWFGSDSNRKRQAA
jgi:hypothetical protein